MITSGVSSARSWSPVTVVFPLSAERNRDPRDVNVRAAGVLTVYLLFVPGVHFYDAVP